jgi:hypothetical protein
LFLDNFNYAARLFQVMRFISLAIAASSAIVCRLSYGLASCLVLGVLLLKCLARSLNGELSGI